MQRDSTSDSTRPRSGEPSALLQRLTLGEDSAREELLPLIYDELHHLAQSYLVRERGNHTLQATALVHEAWMRLERESGLGEVEKEHYMALGAMAMRRVLVDHARAKNAGQRGGRWSRVSLSEAVGPAADGGLDLVEFDDLLQRLEVEDERLSRILTLHLFGGLTNAQIARALGISERLVYKEWQIARAWLWEELDGSLTD